MQLHHSNPIAAPSSWWSRECGGRDVLAIAAPLIVQTCFWSVMWFVDRLFLTWYSPEATAAALTGGMYHWTMICLPVGIASYVNTFVAQYYGAGRHRRIGNAVKQGIWFGWATVPLFLLAIPLAPWLFRGVGSPETSAQQVVYFQVLALGAGAAVISGAQSSFYTGRGLTAIVMVVNCFSTLLDISLEYMFIFGTFGFPSLGIAGAALTTAISNWSTVLLFWLLMRRRGERERFGLDDSRLDWDLTRRLVRFGLPSGLPQLVESLSFTVLTISIASVGVIAGAATSIALTINSVAFVPMFGLNIAVSTIVGQKLGENRPAMAERATWTALHIAMAYTAACALFYVAVPHLFLVLHSTFAEGENFAAVEQATVILLRFVAMYCFFDATQIVLVGALRGAGDTRFVLAATGLTAVVFVALGRIFERFFEWNSRGFGLWGWWWILTVWVFTLGVLYVIRFLGGKWKLMRVIEPELVET